MKTGTIIILSLLTVILSCTVQNKVAYEFPGSMPADVQQEFSKICEKGRILYEINCAGCHNTGKGRRQIIPDFTPEQLKGYELRVANAMHEENMPDEKVTAEELGIISTFLLYKKKSGVVVAKK